MTELEEERYYVVLAADDYRLLAARKQSKLLWEARFSIREVSNRFDTGLPKMITAAEDYFGRDSKGLRHVDMPEGKVEIGPVKPLGPVDDPAARWARGAGPKKWSASFQF